MSRKEFTKYMIEEKLEQLIPPYKIDNWYEPVICANCHREDIIINFAQVEATVGGIVDYYPEGTSLTFEESNHPHRPHIMKDIKCPKCRSGLCYHFKFTIVVGKPKLKKRNIKKIT